MHGHRPNPSNSANPRPPSGGGSGRRDQSVGIDVVLMLIDDAEDDAWLREELERHR